MTVRCKLTLVSKTEAPADVFHLGFQAVTGGDPGSENAQFWASTPTADIEFGVASGRATEMKLGAEFYLDLDPIPQADDLLTDGIGERELPAGCVGVFRVESQTREIGTVWFTDNAGKQQSERGVLVAMKLRAPGVWDRKAKDWPFLGGKIEFGCANMAAVEMLVLDKLYWASLLPAPADES